MNYLEALKKKCGIESDMEAIKTASYHCPSSFGLTKESMCPAEVGNHCIECWLRECDLPDEDHGKLPPILPCPICGGKAELVFLGGNRDCFVRCTKRCVEQGRSYMSKKAATKAWNRRADDGLSKQMEDDLK